MMVVGNKVDLEEERKVPTQRPIREYKEKFDIDCWEVSAKTGFHVKEVMNEMVESNTFLSMRRNLSDDDESTLDCCVSSR
jgi:translation elongation factor EF-4